MANNRPSETVNGTNGNGIASSRHSTESTQLEQLAYDLSKQAKRFSDYLQAKGLPQPSFERDAPISSLPPTAPREIQAAKDKLLDHALQIFQLVAGPGEYLHNVVVGYHYMEIFRWMSYFKIFDLVPLDGQITYQELADKAGVSVQRLKSVARMAMTNHLFAEPTPGYLEHSATSAAMVTNPHFADQRVWISGIIAPTIANMVTAHERWPTSTAPNTTAFNAAFHTDLGLYDYIAKKPELYKLFGRVMDAVAASPKSDLNHLVGGFDWAGLGKAVVVDVGGNVGHGSVSLAKAFPELEFVVQDIPHVVAEGEAIKGSQKYDGSIASRLSFQEYDFIKDKQPIKKAGVYLFRQILHNWDFGHCVTILKNTVASLGPNSHVIIMDFVLPAPGSVSAANERLLRSRDVGMMQMFNSLERDLEGWRAIVDAVDTRLKINSVKTPYGSFMSVIDLVVA